MKKYCFLIIFIACIASSACNNFQSKENKENKNDTTIIIVEELEDLYLKYDSLVIDNCEQLLEMANDISIAYFNTIENASSGNEKAKSDFLDFNLFLSKFDLICEDFDNDCQNKIKNWKTNFNEKKILYNSKIENITKQDTLKYNYKEVGDSIYKNLEKQIEELKNDLSTHLNEELKK